MKKLESLPSLAKKKNLTCSNNDDDILHRLEQDIGKPNTPRLSTIGVGNVVGKVRHYVDGEVLFWQGDKGYESYKILRGKVRVVLTIQEDGTKLTNWKDGKELAQLSTMTEFGGLSKINLTHQRTATCVAVGNVKLEVIGTNTPQLPDLNAPLSHTLADKKEAEQAKKSGELQELMETVTYCHGHFICRQGEVGDCFFIITSGTVDVRVEMDDAISKEKEPDLWAEGGKWVNSMGAGEIFGERAVLSNDPIRSASCVAKGIVKILKMNVTVDTLVQNGELKALLERRRAQLNKQSKQGNVDEESEPDEEDEDEILTPRAHARDYDQYEHELISALDDALATRSQQISHRRENSVQAKEAIYINKRMHADETASARVDVISGEIEGSANAFNGDYDDFVENGMDALILFSDDSDDDEDDGMDALVAAALKSAQNSLLKKDSTNKTQGNGKDKYGVKKHHHHHDKHHHHHHHSHGLADLIKKASEMSPEDRIGGGWLAMQTEATQLLIEAVQQQDHNTVANLLTSLASMPGQQRTDQLRWSVQENNGPLLGINKSDKHGLTATHHAAHVGSLKILQILVEDWKTDLSAGANGYSIWAHALNSISKGLGCTQQVLDWLKIRGADKYHRKGVVLEYTEEYRAEFDKHKKKATKHHKHKKKHKEHKNKKHKHNKTDRN